MFFILLFEANSAVFIILKELFYTDCQRWSYLFESYAVLSLMKIHKQPHVSDALVDCAVV